MVVKVFDALVAAAAMLAALVHLLATDFARKHLILASRVDDQFREQH